MAKRKSKVNDTDYLKVAKPIIKKYAGKVSAQDVAFLINQKLPKDKQIAPSTFAKMLHAGDVENQDLMDLVDLYYIQIIERKFSIVGKLERGSKAWQRYAWLLERLDPEQFNLTFKGELTGKDGQSLFGSKTEDELKELIKRFGKAIEIIK